jgi:hypothetical protein
VTAPKKTPPAVSQEALLKALPDPGPGRIWDVKVVKAASGDPMQIELLEQFREGSKMGETLLRRRTKATIKHIAETAEQMLVDIGDYEKLVGTYERERVL